MMAWFDDNGNLCSYDDFLKAKSFLVKYREFVSVVKAIPTGMIELIKCHLSYQNVNVQIPSVKVDGVDIMDRKCTNKHLRKVFQRHDKFSPEESFFAVG